MANTTIKDPVLEPYYVSKDQYCFTVVETITPDDKNIGRFKKEDKGNQGKNYEKPVSHHSTFAAALSKIAIEKVSLKSEYNSIQSYVAEWTDQQEQLKEVINKISI
jgi:predicted  nucleic acid-binding Zn-ribbon protein